MAKFIPYQKLSKKRQREMDQKKRITWGAINPITKRPERSDAYNRKKEKESALRQARNWRDDGSTGLLLCL